MKSPGVPWIALAVAATAIGYAGCAKSCKNDHPYVPYTIESTSKPSPADDASAPLAVEDAGASPFTERAAQVAPPGQTQWTVDELTLYAPQGRVFALALVRDFDGDGQRDAFAIVRSPEKAELPGEVVFFRGREGGVVGPVESIASATELTNDPLALRQDPAPCVATQRLGQIGRHSVLVELGVGCPKLTAASRWVAVLAAEKPVRTKLSALLYDPAGAPRLTIDADGSDSDGDGIDDLAIRATLEGAVGQPDAPKVSAVMRFLDRPAGLSRDAAATEQSFGALAQTAMLRSARAKEAASVPAFVAQVRSLYRALCPDAGSPRFVKKLGAATLACGASRALEESGLADVRAYVTLGDPLHAIAALDRSSRAPATKTASRQNDAQTWITQAFPVLTARGARIASAVPQVERGEAPSWGALAFEASGKLLIRTAAGVVRFDPEQGDETEAEGVSPWKGAVLSPDGAMRWIEVYNPCDNVALRAVFAPTGEGKSRDVALPVVASKCVGRSGEVGRIAPIAWGARGLEALVAGEPVLVLPDFSRATSPLEKRPSAKADLDAPFVLGSPRSPGGRLAVTATSVGLLVRGGAKPRVYRASDLDGAYATLRDCVVSDDGARIACVRSNKVWSGIWDVP